MFAGYLSMDDLTVAVYNRIFVSVFVCVLSLSQHEPYFSSANCGPVIGHIVRDLIMGLIPEISPFSTNYAQRSQKYSHREEETFRHSAKISPSIRNQQRLPVICLTRNDCS